MNLVPDKFNLFSKCDWPFNSASVLEISFLWFATRLLPSFLVCTKQSGVHHRTSSSISRMVDVSPHLPLGGAEIASRLKLANGSLRVGTSPVLGVFTSIPWFPCRPGGHHGHVSRVLQVSLLVPSVCHLHPSSSSCRRRLTPSTQPSRSVFRDVCRTRTVWFD